MQEPSHSDLASKTEWFSQYHSSKTNAMRTSAGEAITGASPSNIYRTDKDYIKTSGNQCFPPESIGLMRKLFFSNGVASRPKHAAGHVIAATSRWSCVWARQKGDISLILWPLLHLLLLCHRESFSLAAGDETVLLLMAVAEPHVCPLLDDWLQLGDTASLCACWKAVCFCQH